MPLLAYFRTGGAIPPRLHQMNTPPLMQSRLPRLILYGRLEFVNMVRALNQRLISGPLFVFASARLIKWASEARETLKTGMLNIYLSSLRTYKNLAVQSGKLGEYLLQLKKRTACGNLVSQAVSLDFKKRTCLLFSRIGPTNVLLFPKLFRGSQLFVVQA